MCQFFVILLISNAPLLYQPIVRMAYFNGSSMVDSFYIVVFVRIFVGASPKEEERLR